MSQVLQLTEVLDKRARLGRPYTEFLRVPAMSAGLYVLAAGATDTQKPHGEDEIYYVISGRARIRIGEEERPIRDGDLIFVEAAREHRFLGIEQELTLLVVFAPAEGS